MHRLVALLSVLVLFSFVPRETCAQLLGGGEPQQRAARIVVRDIRVEGASTSSPSAIISYSGIRIGDVLQPGSDLIARAVKNLMNRRLFSDVKIFAEDAPSGDGVILVIAVKEYPRVGHVGFSGNEEFDNEELEETVVIREGDIATPYALERSSIKIREKYSEEGYLHTEVSTNETLSVDSGRVSVRFDIVEGPEVSIGTIAFEGNIAVPDEDLKDAMEDVQEKSWYQFWRSSSFDPKELKKDEERVVDYYRSRGYINAEVIGDSIAVDPETGEADILIRVSEGKQVFLRSITVVGNTVYPTDIILRRVDVETGEPYNQHRLEENVNGNEEQTDLRSLYLDNGYLTFNVSIDEQRSENDSVDVVLKVSEGEQARIRYVGISGNTKTKDKVIRRELFTRPGDTFSKAAIISSLRRLANLNYFNPEKLYPDVRPVDNTTVDVVYNVEERPSDTFNASLGLSSQGLTGMIGLSFNNFSVTEPLFGGGGQVLNFNWEFGSFVQTFQLGLTEPYLFDEPLTLGASLFYQVQDFSGISTSSSTYKLKRYGGSMTLGYRLKWPDDYTRIDGVFRAQNNEITGNVASSYYTNGSEVSMTGTLSRSSIDNPVFPTVGSRFSIPITWAGLIGDAKYLKTEIKSDFYSRLAQITESNSLVFYLNNEFGYLYTYGPIDQVPPLAFYSMGGTALSGLNTVPLRGYRDHAIGPIIPGSDIPLGQVYAKTTAELRFGLSVNPIPIFVLAFAEAGNVWGGFSEVDPFNLKRSAGLGIRVMVPPIGLLGFDYGYGFDADSYGQTTSGLGERSGWQFHFQFGR